MKLDSSVAAVVTGGASGLGAATSRALAAQGVKVAIFDFNDEKGEAIAKEIGGDAVDLIALFELHGRAIYDSAVRMSRRTGRA